MLPGVRGGRCAALGHLSQSGSHHRHEVRRVPSWGRVLRLVAMWSGLGTCPRHLLDAFHGRRSSHVFLEGDPEADLERLYASALLCACIDISDIRNQQLQEAIFPQQCPYYALDYVRNQFDVSWSLNKSYLSCQNLVRVCIQQKTWKCLFFWLKGTLWLL